MVGGRFQGNGTLALLGHAEHGMISSRRMVGGGFHGNGTLALLGHAEHGMISSRRMVNGGWRFPGKWDACTTGPR